MLEQKIPEHDACLNCRSTCPRETTCPLWFLSGVLKRVEQAQQEHASFSGYKSSMTGD
jgi:hypothetical protein